jgi:uncharacterized protein (DUF433 family)
VGITDSGPVVDPGASVVSIDPEVHGGAPVLTGTRVPVQTLIELLSGGYDLDELVARFPSVRRARAIAFLERAAAALRACRSDAGRPAASTRNHA